MIILLPFSLFRFCVAGFVFYILFLAFSSLLLFLHVKDSNINRHHVLDDGGR